MIDTFEIQPVDITLEQIAVHIRHSAKQAGTTFEHPYKKRRAAFKARGDILTLYDE